ncbi:MAG TPA: putative nucleotide-diphospho-sugar transferase [Candidatus Babeliales bacterium]|nr:putative nucleotide-diphospho-sugar transferase [Candidatus Babeliales bacterium]
MKFTKYIIVLLFFVFSDYCYANKKIKLYALYTPSHAILKDTFFLPSIQDDFEIIFEFCDQTCPSGDFMGQGWTETTIQKVNLIIRAIKENWGSIFIFSDVDIQFFCPIEEMILKCMHGKDLMIQKNTPNGVLCTGFFACRANEKTLQLWIDVKNIMEQDVLQSDQISLNQCIKRHSKQNPYNLVWGYLPTKYFFGGGTFTGCYWKSGMSLPIPAKAMMHHANFTKGIKNKIAQLTYVRDIVNNRKKN